MSEHRDIPPVLPDDYCEKMKLCLGSDIDDEVSTDYIRDHIRSKGADRELFDVKVGRLLAANAMYHIQTYTFNTVTCVDDAAVVILSSIIVNFTAKCTFDKKVDLYLHQIGRSLLHAERLALIHYEGSQGNPLKLLPQQYDPSVLTDLLLPIIDTPVSDKSNSVDWSTSIDLQDFILATSMLQEMLDNDNLHILMGPHIAFHESMPDAHLFASPMNFVVVNAPFGIVHKSQLIATDMTLSHPIARTLYMLVCKRADAGGKAYQDLLECCTSPESVSHSNPYSRLI